MIKAVEFARFIFKDMDNNIPHIKKDPPSIGLINGRDAAAGRARRAGEGETARTAGPVEPLFELDLDAELMQPLVNAVSHGLDMTGTGRSAEHEIVTKINYLAHVEDNDILRFFIGAEMSSLFGKF